MTDELQKQQARLQGIGTSISVSPPVKELHDRAVSKHADGMSESELRAWLEEELVDHPQIGLLAFFGINRKVGRMSLSHAAVEIGTGLAARLKKKKVRDAFLGWMRNAKLDHFVVDYVLRWTLDGTPPPLAETSVSWVGTWNMGPADDQVTTVAAVCNQLSDPRLVAKEFLEQCHRTFPPETFARKGMAAQDAARFRRFATGDGTDFDIAKDELEAEGYNFVVANKREWSQAVETRANSVLVARKRWDEYLTRLLDI